MSKNENILVVPRAVFEEIGAFEGFRGNVIKSGEDGDKLITTVVQKLFAPDVPRFLPRNEMENDPSYKQIIPYVVLRCGDLFFAYTRGKSSGEQRLVAKGSIGLGGHVNESDFHPDDSVFTYASYLRGLKREITEEVSIDGPFLYTAVLGLVNDESTEVGRVHLGLVHCFELSTTEVVPLEEDISSPCFLSIEELKQRADEGLLENWSKYVVDFYHSTLAQMSHTCLIHE